MGAKLRSVLHVLNFLNALALEQPVETDTRLLLLQLYVLTGHDVHEAAAVKILADAEEQARLVQVCAARAQKRQQRAAEAEAERLTVALGFHRQRRCEPKRRPKQSPRQSTSQNRHQRLQCR